MIHGHREIVRRCNTNSEESANLAVYQNYYSNAVLLSQSRGIKGGKFM